MASNGEWGDAQETPERQKVFEEFESYDALEMTPALQKFLDSRGLQFVDLQRIGTRQKIHNGELTLIYHFPDGLKFRTLSGTRWATAGTEWSLAKRIRSTEESPTEALVVEGETDAALMSRVLPKVDVYILPAGARHISEGIIAQLAKYKKIFIGLDNDEAGILGANKLLENVPNSSRIVPPNGAKDWCEAAKLGYMLGWKPEPIEYKLTYSFGEVVDIDFGSFEYNNWYEEAILPVAGQMLIHARKKSLKSFILLELIRSLTTGTDFADYYKFVHEDGPGRVLYVQLEILPVYFQLRLLSMMKDMPPAEQKLFRQNARVYGIGNNRLPRIKVTDKNFKSHIRRAIQEHDSQVVIFDPIQRITGETNIDKVNETDVLLDFFAELQADGYTVIAAHHNAKSGAKDPRDPDSMVGSQRFSGDPDSVCTVWHDEKTMVSDSDSEVKQRNFTWTLRNGAAQGRSITTRPDRTDPTLITVEFDKLITDGGEDESAPEF